MDRWQDGDEDLELLSFRDTETEVLTKFVDEVVIRTDIDESKQTSVYKHSPVIGTVDTRYLYIYIYGPETKLLRNHPHILKFPRKLLHSIQSLGEVPEYQILALPYGE
ncbi:hypothetical protein MPER_16444 [Moniliophthora perniciosa FA553]|nr:hypothetical protein MPER_16444 [Moniliophthora perniciosa FA553]